MKIQNKIAIALISLSLLTGCGNSATSPTSTASPQATSAPAESKSEKRYSGPAAQFTDEDKKASEKLLEGWNQDGYFEHKSTMDKANGRGYLFLAASSPDLEKKAGAFVAIKNIYVDYETDKKLLVDDDYNAIVAAHLNHADKGVQMRAIEAAYPAVRGNSPNVEIVEMLVDICRNHPVSAAKYHAGASLNAMSGSAREANPEVPKVMVELYEEKPYVAASAIGWTYNNFQDDEVAEKSLFDALLKAMENEHPVVRGNALEKFASLSKDKAKVLDQAKKLSEDSDPFVVAQALKVLGESGDESVIPVLAKFFDDERDCSVSIKFENLAGKGTQTNHGGLVGRSVADAATRALDKVTDGRPGKGFEADKVGFGKKAAADVAKNVTAAKAWVAKNAK